VIEQIQALQQEAEDALAGAKAIQDVEALRVRFLGKKGALTGLLRGLGSLSVEERPQVGQAANEVKQAIEARIADAFDRLKKQAQQEQRSKRSVDVSLPGSPPLVGSLHPLTLVRQEILDIFGRMGFRVEVGPEVETEFFNFEALGIPKDHPARDMQDTFYVGEQMVLRTHTSPVQIRAVLERRKPPVRIVAPGAVYRRDSDVSHSPMFHQVEGLMIEEGVHFGHLKGILDTFAREMFGEKNTTRFRPSYFPFTEPSAEVDVSCFLCDAKGCRVCKDTGWIEILGCGMVDPVVFEEVANYDERTEYDPTSVTGFAFGMGIERIAMLKYRIPDIRLFFDNDINFLKQFGS